ncbi:MAG: thioredoxin family protein [Cryomorphaceae bacterium]
MKNELYKAGWEHAMDYEGYRSFIAERLAVGKTTGDKPSPSLVAISELNVHRMSRIEKTFAVDRSALDALREVSDHAVLLTLTEGWCGDAAQILPVIEAIAKALNIESRYLLRDENDEIMDEHLTNGSRSIPIMLVLDKASFQVIGSFGPRPSGAQAMLEEYKFQKEPKLSHTDFTKNIQLWYARDKYKSTQKEIIDLLSKVLQPDA